MSQALGSEASPAAREKAAPGFVCTSRNAGVGAAWVRVAGELDLATAPRLEQTLRQAQGRVGLVVLDLRELAFTDCFGVHVIVEAAVRARRDYRQLIVVRAPASVDRVFTLTRASDVVEIVDLDSPEPAIQGLLRLAQMDQAA
jgi:anti-sigma B factor antagonist